MNNLDKIKDLNMQKTIINDIIISGVKETASDMLSSILDTLTDCGKDIIQTILFGETNHRSKKTSYNTISTRRRGSSRNTVDVKSIPFDDKLDAADVLAAMKTKLRKCGHVTVADYYTYASFDSDFTDEKYGWTNLSTATIVKRRDYYMITLPAVIEL